MPKLTKRIVDSAKPQIKRRILWDTEVPGFGLLILPSGTKTFVLNYRNSERRERRLTLGRYGVVTADQARKLALAALVSVQQGSDPVLSRRAESDAPNVSQLAARYLTDHVHRHNAQSTQIEFERLVEKHIVPELGRLKVPAVTRQDVVKLHKSMAATPRQANHALSVLSKMFSLAEIWGLREEGSNPARAIPRFKEIERDRFLSNEEIERLGRAIAEAETIGLPWHVNEGGPGAKHLAMPENRRTKVNPCAILAIKLLLLTGSRLSEIMKLEWQHVDLERRTLALPSRKGRDRKPHPISDVTHALLAEAAESEAGKFVHPSPADPDLHISKTILEKAWQRVRSRAGLDDVRLHDLRHTVGTYASQAGANTFTISHLLRQKTLAVTSRYVNPDADPIRQTFNQIGERIQRRLAGTNGK